MYRVILEQAGSAPPNVSQTENNYVYNKELTLSTLDEMDQMHSAQSRKAAVEESILRQRDIFRVILARNTPPNVSQHGKN